MAAIIWPAGGRRLAIGFVVLMFLISVFAVIMNKTSSPTLKTAQSDQVYFETIRGREVIVLPGCYCEPNSDCKVDLHGNSYYYKEYYGDYYRSYYAEGKAYGRDDDDLCQSPNQNQQLKPDYPWTF